MDIPGYDDAIGTVLHLYTVSRKIDWRIAVMFFEHLGGCSGPQEAGGPERGTQRKSSKCLHGTRPLMPFWSIRKRACPCNVTVRADRSGEHTSDLQSLMRLSYAVFGM